MNIMFIGIAYSPFYTAGDKNFFVQLLTELIKKEKVNKIVVISINDLGERVSVQQIGNYRIMIYNLKRSLHINYKKFFHDINNNLYYRHHHGIFQETIERSLCILNNLNLIKFLVQKEQINIIHFMDNFGPIMGFLKKLFPKIKLTYSPPFYNKRVFFYDLYLKYSFKDLDKIFPFTDSYKNILISLGIPEKKTNKNTMWHQII